MNKFLTIAIFFSLLTLLQSETVNVTAAEYNATHAQFTLSCPTCEGYIGFMIGANTMGSNHDIVILRDCSNLQEYLSVTAHVVPVLKTNQNVQLLSCTQSSGSGTAFSFVRYLTSNNSSDYQISKNKDITYADAWGASSTPEHHLGHETSTFKLASSSAYALQASFFIVLILLALIFSF